MTGTSPFLRAAAAVCALLLCAPAADADSERSIVLLNWSDYIDQALINEFSAETGIGVQQVYYANDTDRDAIVAQSDPGEFDVVIMSGDRLQLLSDAGWLAPIGEQEVPNASHIDDEWRTLFAPAGEYALPMSWGTVGIAYRRDMLSRPIDSWSDVFEPTEELCGRLWMFADGRENFEIALLALGVDESDPTPAELDAARQLLMHQRDCVAAYDYPDITKDSQLIAGEIAAALVYSGDAVYFANREDRIEYVLPDDRTILWVDHYTVPASSTRKSEAYAFIDFMNRPGNAARLAETLWFLSPNRPARSLMSANVLRHPTIALPADVERMVEQPRSAGTLRSINLITAELWSIEGVRP